MCYIMYVHIDFLDLKHLKLWWYRFVVTARSHNRSAWSFMQVEGKVMEMFAGSYCPAKTIISNTHIFALKYCNNQNMVIPVKIKDKKILVALKEHGRILY